MSSLPRWVLAHKRLVAAAWVLLTIAGFAASGPASRALDPEFSVPNKEGWETNVDIAKRYFGTGGDSAPLVPVVTLPAGKTVASPGVKADLTRMDADLRKALPRARTPRYASPVARPFGSKDGPTPSPLPYPPPSAPPPFGENPEAE